MMKQSHNPVIVGFFIYINIASDPDQWLVSLFSFFFGLQQHISGLINDSFWNNKDDNAIL